MVKRILKILFLMLPIVCVANANLEEALYHYHKGDFQKSYELLKKYVYTNQANDKIVFAYARSAYEIGYLDEAEILYVELLKGMPNNPRIKLELAQIYSQKPKYHFKANTLYQEILNTEAVPDSVKNKVKIALSSLNTKEQNHFFNLFFGVGGGFDTNIYNASDKQFVDVITPFSDEPLPFKIHDGKKLDKFIEYFLSIKHQYSITDNTELNNKITLYSQKYKKEDTEDMDAASFESTISHTNENLRKSISLSYGRIVSDNKSHINIYTISPYIDYIIDENLIYKGKAKFIKKNFIKDDDKFKSSKRAEIYNSISRTTENFGINTIEFSFGTENADGTRKLNIDHNFMGFKYENFYPLTAQTLLLSAIEYTYSSYKVQDKENLLYKFRRKDKKYIFDFSVMQSINDTLSIGLNYRYINNDSNQDVYNYHKQTTKMNLFYSF